MDCFRRPSLHQKLFLSASVSVYCLFMISSMPTARRQLLYQAPEEDDDVMAKWEGERGVREAQRVISLYLAHRRDGRSREDIRENVFNVSLPNAEPQEHLDSYPFLSGDTLRAFADVVFERKVRYLYVATHNTWTVRPNNRRLINGDVLFVKSDDVEQFAIDILPKINTKFILVTHNSDFSRPVEPRSIKMLDDTRLIVWFAENAARTHPKLRPIPIGLQNQNARRSGDISRLEKFIEKAPPLYSPYLGRSPRSILVYINFTPFHHPLRKLGIKTFEAIGTVQERNRDNLDGYWTNVLNSKFVLSPPGHGEDCHRTWESVLLGAIPIVKNSTLDPLFALAPTYVLKNWENKVDERQFLTFHASTMSKQTALAQFWFDVINSYRKKP